MSAKRGKAVRKISRRLGVDLWGRGDLDTRNYPPGQHGPRLGPSKSRSDYGKQLVAKKTIQNYYGISEKALRRLYKEAIRRKGDSSQNLIGLLESLLLAVVYRANLAPSVFAARQLVNHKHVKVNGKIVNIPTYLVKEGDVIEIREKSREIPIILECTQKGIAAPSYMSQEPKEAKVTFIRAPKLEDVPYPVTMEPSMVIEFYSR